MVAPSNGVIHYVNKAGGAASLYWVGGRRLEILDDATIYHLPCMNVFMHDRS